MNAKHALGLARIWMVLAVVPMVVTLFTSWSSGWEVFSVGSIVVASVWIAASCVLKAIEERQGWMTEAEWIRKTMGR